MSDKYDDVYDYYPEEFRADVIAIGDTCRNGVFTDNDLLNKRLVEYFIANGDRIGLPHKAKCLVNNELTRHLQSWGWPKHLLDKVARFDYVISSYEGGGGPALIDPEGGWIGAVEWKLARNLRAAWVNKYPND